MDTIQPKMVDYGATCLSGDTLLPCCKEGKSLVISEAMSVAGERGYLVVSPKCACPSRFIRHDWRLGTAVFRKGKA